MTTHDKKENRLFLLSALLESALVSAGSAELDSGKNLSRRSDLSLCYGIALQGVVNAHGNVFNNSPTTALCTLILMPSKSCSIFACISAFRCEIICWNRRSISFLPLSQASYSFGNRVLRCNAVIKDFSDAMSNFSERHNTTSFPLTKRFNQDVDPNVNKTYKRSLICSAV